MIRTDGRTDRAIVIAAPLCNSVEAKKVSSISDDFVSAASLSAGDFVLEIVFRGDFVDLVDFAVIWY